MKEPQYRVLPDGTIKQINPFTGTEVWAVPGRGQRPHCPGVSPSARPLIRRDPEDYCAFCYDNMLQTPPEKERLICREGSYRILQHVPVDDLFETRPLFRRVANLFEIVTMDYWDKNHGHSVSGSNLQWQQEYLGSSAGKTHVVEIVRKKLEMMECGEKDASSPSESRILQMAGAFFAGGHELILGGNHFRSNAATDEDFFSSGDLTPAEHVEYLKFTIRAMLDIYSGNPHVRYVSIFQNWLKSAGASFSHLHKQLVGIDEWGLSVEKEVALLKKEPNIYNEKIVNFAFDQGFVIAQNAHAVALAEMGHRYPTLAVYSKSENGRPQDHAPEELAGFSHLVHACHAATGPQISSNEEWYYAPKDAPAVMPWHILIKWRTTMHAGFEGGTRIYINPLTPRVLRDSIAARMLELREQGKVKAAEIGDECVCRPNSLRYHVA